jgi:gamma-glutamyltranspeptidase/glutathione hydrolase
MDAQPRRVWKSRGTLRLIALAWISCVGAVSARADEALHDVRQVVIAGHPLAAQLGLQVLNEGGTAADALVTTSLALGITEPGNSGLGGKLILTYFDAKSGKVTSVAALNAAPAAATPERVRQLTEDQRSRNWTSVCVPGLAAGLGESHRRWGTRPWKDLVDPVAKLAEEGFVLSPLAAEMMSEYEAKYDAEAARIFMPLGKSVSAGDRLTNPDLAWTLRKLSAGGAAAFYEGEIADRIAAASKARGGLLEKSDLVAYRPRVLEPTHITWRGFDVYSSPPPLTGGATVLGALQALEASAWNPSTPRDATYIDAVARVLQQVYQEIGVEAADFPASGDRVRAMLSPENAKAVAARARQTTNPAKPTRAPRQESGRLPTTTAGFASAGPEALLDDSPSASTTHLIIVDKHGNVACCTQSLGLHFGAQVVAGGTGVLMNSDISNFSFNQASPNLVGPGKWPRSTMSPTIFVRNGKPALAIGSPAAQRIPPAVLQVAIDVLQFDRPLKEAIRAPRFHVRRAASSTAAANQIDLEKSTNPDLVATLKSMGWSAALYTRNDFYFGSVNAVRFDADGRLSAVADLRRTNDVSGN